MNPSIADAETLAEVKAYQAKKVEEAPVVEEAKEAPKTEEVKAEEKTTKKED